MSKKDVYDIRPEAPKKSGPQPAVEWENENDAALAAATEEAVLKAFVADEKSARQLLARINKAYWTNPIVACQIGAISQMVINGPEERRKVWVGALLATAETDAEPYVKTFCLDQLRWCGCVCPRVRERIRGIGEKCGDKAVKEMAAIVLRELQ